MNSNFDILTLELKKYIENIEKENAELKQQISSLITEVKEDNLNSIVDSGLESGQKIIVAGDSHSLFFYKSKKMIALWGGLTHEFPLTIYRLINSNIDIRDLPRIIGRGHENIIIGENDFVMYTCGFNDIQKNIYLHAKDRWQEETVSLLVDYIKLFLYYKQNCNIIPIISCIYPNPLPDAQGVTTFGTYEERHMYTKYANLVLKQLCCDNKLLFFDIYDYISDENGYIKKEYSHDKIHLDPNNNELRTFVETTLIELCKSWSS
jgi:hypothetical protein